MTVSTFDGFIGATKQFVFFNTFTVRPGWSGLSAPIEASWASTHDYLYVPGGVGTGNLGVGNTANGLVPTDATNGFPKITFSSGTGYLGMVRTVSNNNRNMFVLYDRLFHAGAYSFNANVTLSAQPSYSGRIPGGDYSGTQIWIEAVTAFTGILNVAVTYTDQGGNAGHTTGTIAAPATGIPAGLLFPLPLAAGDSGVQKIESVVATVAAAGTFNVVVQRPIWGPSGGADATSPASAQGSAYGLEAAGMPQIFPDSCLAVRVRSGSGSPGPGQFHFFAGIFSG